MARELGYNPAKISDQRFSRRVKRLIFVLLALILILAIRLFYLQVIKHDFYLTQEEHNRSNLLAIEPSRGILTDRNGVIIADNVAVYSLMIERERVPHLHETLTALEKLLNLDPRTIQIFLKDVKNHPRFAPIPLINHLSDQQIAAFMINQYRFPGVIVTTNYIRHYPLGEALAPVTGYVNRINPKELQQVDPANYSATTNIGKSGVEKYFEKQLHGQIGYQRIAMDARGRKVRELSSIPPIPGNNIELTIDSRLQIAAYKAFKGQRGALVAIQPKTGQILALISSPSFDPNLFIGGIDSKTYQDLRADPNQPLYNRAVRGLFPFGSTIKPFYALEGLDSGIITPDFSINDPGYFKLPGVSHIYHNWKRGGIGRVNVTRAIEQSNDTFFFTLSIKMGINKMANILHAFGFGAKTGIEIEEELAGNVATPEWKRAKKHTPWFAGDTLASGIGQGYMLMTPLQLAHAVATLAVRGERYRPTLLFSEQSPDGKTYLYKTAQLFPVKLQNSTWDVVINGMQRVVNVGTGSYHYGQSLYGKPTYTVAAKTGTAQVFNLAGRKYNKAMTPINLRDNSLFIAFAPVENPEIAVAVVLEHEDTAGVIAREVIDYYLKNILHPAQVVETHANPSLVPDTSSSAPAKTNDENDDTNDDPALAAPDAPDSTDSDTEEGEDD